MQIEQYFLNREDPLEQDEYDELYTLVSKSIPPERLELLPRLSFMMLKPNAYLAGQMPALIEELRREGVYIFAHRFGTLTPEEIDELYKFVKIKYWDSWWVMPRLYKLASCLSAIVVGEPGDFPHLSARIREIVGPTTPIRGNMDGIRYRFRSPHRVFNTVHATDDPASAVREAIVFFDLDDIIRALDAVSEGKFPEDPTLDPAELVPEETFELNYGIAKSDVKRQLYGIITGVLARDGFGGYRRIRNLADRLGHFLDEERGVLEKRLPLREEFDALRIPLQMQRLTVDLMATEARGAMASLFRGDVVAGTSNADLAKGLHEILEAAEMIAPMTDEVVLMDVPDFEAYMAHLMRLGVDFDRYTEVLLLAGWAASGNEWMDIALKMDF